MQTVAYQGVEGAYSQMAAQNHFSSRIKAVAIKDFAGVFQAVIKGRARYGVVPIENSLAGSIHQNYDLLLKHKVWICGEVKHRIVHNLLVKKGVMLSDIKEIYSHPQALAQCEKFIAGLRRVQPMPFFDTAGAVQHVAESDRQDIAAIASHQAASVHGLKKLKSGIEDNHQNYTRFIVLEKLQNQMDRGRSRSQKPHKTSIVFALKNIPGGLQKSLSVFAIRDIDLLKIESRPLHGYPWKYLFYLDFAGDYRDPMIKRTLDHLREVAKYLKVLGSYPAAVKDLSSASALTPDT